MAKIGLGGGCHWCTEGVFQSLIGIKNVQQGWISSANENATFSEAVLIDFDPEIISLKDLIEIHLHTHSSTSAHSFREKYRSAVYVFDEEQKTQSEVIIKKLNNNFKEEVVTEVLDFRDFKLNTEEYLNYLYSRKDNAFCENYIHPKLTLLMERFSSKVNSDKVELLISNRIT